MATMKDKFHDLGLSYEAAGHGVQSAIAFEIEKRNEEAHTASERLPDAAFGPKHLRTGLDLRAADAAGLASLLIDKGLFTAEEYAEYMRLAANTELVRYEKHVRGRFALPDSTSFR